MIGGRRNEMDDQPDEVNPVWEYTTRTSAHVRNSPEGSSEGGPYGSYMGRHVIGRDSRIVGGISMVAGYPILIVVEEEDGVLPRIYEEMAERIARGNVRRLDALLAEVRSTVAQAIPYNYKAIKQICLRESPDGKERVLQLSLFVVERTGTCWHQGLMAAYLIEKLIEEGYIHGTVSTDRNMKRDRLNEWVEYAVRGYVGHQWARYTTRNGVVYIVDEAQGYCGKLVDVPLDKPGFWRDYFRPDDLIRARRILPPPLFDPLDRALIAAFVAWLIWHAL